LDNLTKHRKVFGYAETEQKTLKGGYLFFVVSGISGNVVNAVEKFLE